MIRLKSYLTTQRYGGRKWITSRTGIITKNVRSWVRILLEPGFLLHSYQHNSTFHHQLYMSQKNDLQPVEEDGREGGDEIEQQLIEVYLCVWRRLLTNIHHKNFYKNSRENMREQWANRRGLFVQ